MTKGIFSTKKTLQLSQFSLKGQLCLLFFLFLLSSCLPTENSGSSSSKRSSGVVNSQDSVKPGYGRLLEANPIVVSGNSNLSYDADLSLYLDEGQDFIVHDQHLNGDCKVNGSSVSPCYRVKKSKTEPQTNNPSARWAFPTDTLEFLEVNTFGHMKRFIERYQKNLNFNTSSPNYDSNIPVNDFDNSKDFSAQKAFWFDSPLLAYSNCNSGSASFDPALPLVCMGRSQKDDNFKWAQDPSVLYHEMGHAFTDVTLNIRNETFDTPHVDLKNFFYDEGGVIGEGIADYASYLMNKRTHIGEWGMGRFNQSRPMSEQEGIHVAGIDTNSTGRLSYPDFVNYDPNFPEDPIEDIHYGGQIVSHYLVALTKDLEQHCSFGNHTARNKVLEILTESLVELGDTGAKGNDNNAEGYINHSPEHALEWLRIANPINLRRFAQSMGKNLNRVIANNSLSGCDYSEDQHEELLDSYGLLLFKTYNEDGNGNNGHQGPRKKVTNSSRVKTVLIKKDLIKLDPRQNASQGFIFDNRSDMLNAYEGLNGSGQIDDLTSLIASDLPYNNGNGQISPGEFVGLALNLYNDSNSAMGGAQVLANDWDHVKWNMNDSNKGPKLCNNFGDNFPSTSEGGADTTSESSPYSEGECNYITRENGDEPDEKLAPVCFIQINDDSSTRWAIQEEFRKEINLDSSKCLHKDKPNSCFINAVEGAESAYYSKIDPKSTWSETITEGDESPNFNFSNLLYFEVSPWVPPGTKFNCRLRVRFTNCKDCFHDEDEDGDDYLDYEYSGGDPFKIINFQFTVID